jgi:hypothetical protein
MVIIPSQAKTVQLHLCGVSAPLVLPSGKQVLKLAWHGIKIEARDFSRKLLFFACSSSITSRFGYEQISTKSNKPYTILSVSPRRSQLWQRKCLKINVHKDPIERSFVIQSLNHDISMISGRNQTIQALIHSTFKALSNPYNNCKN